MTPPDPVDPTSPCPCGSGLRYARCCGLDWTAPWPEPGPAPEVGRARAALAAGNSAEAERATHRASRAFAQAHRRVWRCCYELRAAPEPDGGGGGAARAHRAARSQQSHMRPRRWRFCCSRKARWPRPKFTRATPCASPRPIAQSHNLMGMIMTEAQRPQVGEHHYRRAMKLLGGAQRRSSSPISPGTSRTRGAWRSRGSSTKSRCGSTRRSSRPSMAGRGWRRPTAISRAPANCSTRRRACRPETRASSCTARSCTDASSTTIEALAALDDIERRRAGGDLGPIEWSEKGLLLDRMGRYAEAFAAFSEAKRNLRALTGQSYWRRRPRRWSGA